MLKAYKFAKFVFRHIIPSRSRYAAARGTARLIMTFNPQRRAVIENNLRVLVGEKRARELTPVVFGNFLMTAVDFFCPRKSLLTNVRRENWHVLDKAWRKSRRVMLVTAHVGNWELGITTLVDSGYSVAGVYAPYREDEVVQWILAHRNTDVEWIPAVRGAAEACIDALRRGRLVGMVADIPFGERGRKVSIAGRHTRLPLGPWAIASKADATVIPAFIIRESPGRYRVTMHDPIHPPEGSFRHRVETMQDAFRAHLEKALQEHPEQWGVLQNFWE
jgi:lauroyl/myristoyl acyltransferase